MCMPRGEQHKSFVFLHFFGVFFSIMRILPDGFANKIIYQKEERSDD